MSLDFEVEHHPAILVFEVVAVEDEFAFVIGESHDDAHLFSGEYEYSVFPAFFPGLYDSASAVPAEYLKLYTMEVHRMRFSTCGVVKLPDFGCASVYYFITAVSIE